MDSHNARRKQRKLEEVLSEKQVDYIVKKMLDSGVEWRVVSSEVKPAADGMVGFLGDHLRIALNVATEDARKTLQLFVKRLPAENPDKTEFIVEYNFFKKEAMVCQLLEKILTDKDGEPWCVKALISTDSMLVMPDMRPLGYANCSQKTLDLPHLLLSAASIARFHATTANYEKNKVLRNNKPWTFSQEFADIFIDRQFSTSEDTPFLRASAKVTSSVLQTFSKKHNYTSGLESKILDFFVQACHCLKEQENTLNVLLHKDLWSANILFRYEKGEPVNALLIDYQCMCYGPPAVDLMLLLHCTTSRLFREQHERAVLQHYYSIFVENLEETTKQKLAKLGYDETEFLQWCEKAREFAMTQASAFSPMFLMDPVTAQRVFDDPKTSKEVFLTDRTKPVLEFCLQNPWYLQRNLEINEELFERYLEK